MRCRCECPWRFVCYVARRPHNTRTCVGRPPKPPPAPDVRVRKLAPFLPVTLNSSVRSKVGYAVVDHPDQFWWLSKMSDRIRSELAEPGSTGYFYSYRNISHSEGPAVSPYTAAVEHPAAPSPPRLLDRVRDKLRKLHYSHRTEEAYVGWIKRFIWFHNKRHPKDMGAAEVEAFLSNLATRRGVSASTQNQALCGLLFLYKQVFGIARSTGSTASRGRNVQSACRWC